MCQLSKLMVEIGSFQIESSFNRQWRTDEQAEMSMAEVFQVTTLESRLNQWRDDFQQQSRSVAEKDFARMSKVPIYMLQVYNA